MKCAQDKGARHNAAPEETVTGTAGPVAMALELFTTESGLGGQPVEWLLDRVEGREVRV